MLVDFMKVQSTFFSEKIFFITLYLLQVPITLDAATERKIEQKIERNSQLCVFEKSITVHGLRVLLPNCRST